MKQNTIIEIKGRLTKEATILTGKTGIKVAFFCIADNHFKKNTAEDGSSTYEKAGVDFVQCKACGEFVNIIERAQKGQVISLITSFIVDVEANDKHPKHKLYIIQEKDKYAALRLGAPAKKTVA